MAEKGWYATGLLRPLWENYPGKRDGLAAKVGTTGNALSARNSGARRLGIALGQRLADELGVSLVELGAPEAAAVDQASRTLSDRLQALADDLADAVEGQAKLAREVRQLRGRVARLEARPWPEQDEATG